MRAAGPAPVGTAWERYTDLRAWPTWSPQIAAVRAPAPPRLRAGLAGEVLGVRWRGHPLLVVSFVVTAVDTTGRSWAWDVEPRRALVLVPRPVARWARMHLVHSVGASGRGSTTSLELVGPAPVVIGYALPARVALRRLVR